MSNNDIDAERRRNLIKAAAAAPLIATLPHGAVHANASVNQCIIDSAQDSRAQAATIAENVELDTWVRVPTVKNEWTKEDQDAVEAWDIDGALYKEDGEFWRSSSSAAEIEGWTKGEDVPVYVLQIVTPDDPEAPTDIHLEGSWPAFQLSEGDNMGISGTCLCSVRPGLIGGVGGPHC